jgi:ParB family chromosome partitioning protein
VTITNIPVSKLQLSPTNVRKSNPATNIEQLADDILGHGLLTNLGVKAAKGRRATYDVIFGGRRLSAIQLLVARGDWPANAEVPCRILEGDNDALSEISLAENFQREAMTPADECNAFLAFMGDDPNIANVARRFGLTERHVAGRLRLARLAPEIFETLQSGKMTLDIAKAYAATDDQAKQLYVFQQYGCGNDYGHSADAIRRAIQSGGLKGNSPIALLVGEADYTGAGGRIGRDLFSDHADVTWLDPEIAQSIAARKLEDEARRIAGDTGIGWIRPIASETTWEAAREFHRVNLPMRDPTPEEVARIEAIEARIETITTELEDETISDERAAELEAQFNDISAEMRDLDNRDHILPDEWRAQVGQFLKLTAKGEMVLDPSIYSETELHIERGEDGGFTARSMNRADRHTSAPAIIPTAAAAPGGKAVSQKLFDRLAIQRRDVLAASLLHDHGLALDFLIFSLSSPYSHMGTGLKSSKVADPSVGEMPPTRAVETLAAAQDQLDKTWLERSGTAERFAAFRNLDDEAKAAWLAYVVANSLEAKQSYDRSLFPFHDVLAGMLNLDVAAMWRPTAENYFLGIQKAGLLTLLHQLGGENLSSRYAASKKPEIADALEKICAGNAIVEPEVKERALAWLPNTMRFGTNQLPDPLDEDSDEELEPAIGDDGEDLADQADADHDEFELASAA